jgi:hypothetical protein
MIHAQPVTSMLGLCLFILDEFAILAILHYVHLHTPKLAYFFSWPLILRVLLNKENNIYYMKSILGIFYCFQIGVQYICIIYCNIFLRLFLQEKC